MVVFTGMCRIEVFWGRESRVPWGAQGTFVFIRPDGSRFDYVVRKERSTLFIAEGLRWFSGLISDSEIRFSIGRAFLRDRRSGHLKRPRWNRCAE